MSFVPPHVHHAANAVPRHTLPWSKYYWDRGQLKQRTVNARLRAYLELNGPATFHRIVEGPMKGQFEMRNLDGSRHRLVLELAQIYGATTMKTLELAGVLDLWTQEVTAGGTKRAMVYGPKAG